MRLKKMKNNAKKLKKRALSSEGYWNSYGRLY